MSHETRGRTLSAADFLDARINEPPKVVDGLIPGGTVTVFAGQHKVGKTVGLVQMSLAVASGKPWITWPTTQGRVVYYNGEVAEWGFQKRLRASVNGFTAAYGKDALASIRNNFFSNSLSDLRINKTADLAVIRDHVERTGAVLCVLDPIGFFYTGKRNEDESVARVMSNLVTEVVEPTGCAVVLAHHMRKPAPGESGGGSTWEVKGSGVWADAADQIITLRWKDKKRVDRLMDTTLRYYESTDNIPLRLKPASMMFEVVGQTGSQGPTDTDLLRSAFYSSLTGELSMADIADVLGIEKAAAQKRWQRNQYPNVVKVDSSGFYEWREQ